MESVTPLSPVSLDAVSPATEADGITIVDEQIKVTQSPQPPEERAASSEATTPRTPLRQKLRVLFITYEDAFTGGSLAYQRYASYSDLFEEVHVIVLTEGDTTFDSVKLAPNVWVYPTNSARWWMYPIDIYRVIKRQLFFAGLFRADIVSANDPFELGLMGYMVSKWWKVAFSLEASERLFDPDFLDESDDNPYRMWFSRMVLPRADRIRARNTHLKEQLTQELKLSSDRIDVIPRHVELTGLGAIKTNSFLKEQYPHFTFYIVVASPLETDSGVDIALNAASHVLRQYPSICMVIFGYGKAQKKLEALVKEKGLVGKVFFEPTPDDLASYLASADLLMVPRRTARSEETLLAAAGVALPIIATTDAVLPEVFVDRESALITKPGDLGSMITSITAYMNDSVMRKRFGTTAQERMHALVKDESQNGRGALRSSMEEAVFALYEREDTHRRLKEEEEVDDNPLAPAPDVVREDMPVASDAAPDTTREQKTITP
jgi:glycosyltransferase involved in cell wall biosynthesis